MMQKKSHKEEPLNFKEFDKKYGNLLGFAVIPIYYIIKFFKKVGLVPILLIIIIIILLLG